MQKTSGGKKTTCAIHKQEQLQQKSAGQIALLFEIMTVNIKHLFMSQQTRTLSISHFQCAQYLERERERTMIQLEKTEVNTSSWMCTDIPLVLFDLIFQKN